MDLSFRGFGYRGYPYASLLGFERPQGKPASVTRNFTVASQMKTLSRAAAMFNKGIAEYQQAYKYAVETKRHAFASGMYFMDAQANARHGEFLDLIKTHTEQISQAQVYRTMEFANLMLDWARKEMPQGSDALELQRTALEVVMKSPKPWTSLLREMKLVTQVGAYDADRYQESARVKRNGGAQFTFHFEDFERHVKALSLGNDIHNLAPSSLEKLEVQLETALTRVREVRQLKMDPAHGNPDTEIRA